MKKYLSSIISVSILFTTAFSTFAASDPQVFIRGVRPLGMGGAFTAIADDQNAVFYNPAGITQRQGSLMTAFELPINISEDVMNFNTFYSDNKDKLDKFDSLSNLDKLNLLNEINDRITTYKPALRTGFPNTSYISGPGFLSWGLGLYDQANLSFQFNRSLIIPTISFFGNVDAIAAAPIAHKFDKLPLSIPGSISAGLTLKAIYRGQIAEYNKSVLEFENFDPLIQTGKGFGFDVGTLYQLNHRWNFGLQITDLGGTTISYDAKAASKAGQVDRPAYTNMINSQWNAGTAYIPSKIVYWPGKSINTNDRLILAADVRDLMSTDERLLEATFWKKLHLGAELRWGPASIRGGYNSGYPTFGFGVRVPYLGLRADYAYWADELGRYAGQMPEWNHQITLALSWGDQKGRAYGKDAVKDSRPVKAAEPKAVKPAPAVVPVKALTPSTTAAVPAAVNASTSTAVPLSVNTTTTTTGVQPKTANQAGQTAAPVVAAPTTPAAAATAKPVQNPAKTPVKNIQAK